MSLAVLYLGVVAPTERIRDEFSKVEAGEPLTATEWGSRWTDTILSPISEGSTSLVRFYTSDSSAAEVSEHVRQSLTQKGYEETDIGASYVLPGTMHFESPRGFGVSVSAGEGSPTTVTISIRER